MFGGDKDMARKALMPNVPEDELKPMYVVSNELGSYGAASILNDNFMDSIKEQIGDDVFMIPSSVHEFIAVPNNDNLSAEELQQMVADVNCNVLAPTDKLSDNRLRRFNRKMRQRTRPPNMRTSSSARTAFRRSI